MLNIYDIALSSRRRPQAECRRISRLPRSEKRQGHAFSSTYRVTSMDEPPYGHMLTSDRVFKRQDIYGVGPSVTFVDSQIAELTTMLSGRTLDFGCGSGALVNLLCGRGLGATGIDRDTPGIRRDVVQNAVPYVAFYDGGTLPFGDGTFDWVTATEVIEHIDDFHQALAEIACAGKSLLMTVPDATAISRLSGAGVVPWHLLEATHVNFFSPRSLRAALHEHFREVEVGQIRNTVTNDQVWSVNLWAVARH